MKAQGINLRLYWRVLVKKFIFAWQIETAYIGNTAGDLFSTLFYNITFIIFIDIVLRKFKLLAGYTFNDMLVLIFFSQVVYYSGMLVTYESASLFVKAIREGIFDTLLIKPISLLFQVMTLGLRPFSGLFFSVPPLILYVLLIIKYQALHPNQFGLIIGTLGILIGIVFLHFYRFAFAMLVFRSKQVKNLLKTLDLVGDAGSFPFEAYRGVVKTIVLFISPILAGAGIPSLYFLNKTESLIPFAIQIGLLMISILATFILWKDGLKRYESVSS